jgi:hexokinase
MMVNNTEWGAFDNAREVLPTTPFDSKLDRESVNPRFQAYEKFISGMYPGEFTRNVLLALDDAAPKPILFHGKLTERLNRHYVLVTKILSLIESAWRAERQGLGPGGGRAHCTARFLGADRGGTVHACDA